jgi:hypothetical protein
VSSGASVFLASEAFYHALVALPNAARLATGVAKGLSGSDDCIGVLARPIGPMAHRNAVGAAAMASAAAGARHAQ